ncbi:hypothetical protein ABTX81_22100 [Kitasatospora sp. NPDC097605]|uniref:hypothetical protein n=1 Tax=Kitasatospora sp. NPDC097605 TaxID=3157226 RepID=UPI00332CBFC6
MSVVLLTRPSSPTHPTTAPKTGTLRDKEREASARTCPVCGSASTFQTMDGRWGCTQCGSTWS